MRHIVVGVAGTAVPEPAVCFAMEEAVRRRLPLEAVHAYDLPSMADLVVDLALQHAPRGRAAAESRLAAAVAAAREIVPGARTAQVRLSVAEGPPADCLVKRVPNAALIVVGARGGGPALRAARGSVSASVLHRSWAPVVVVPDTAPVVAHRFLSSRVVVALDGSPASLAALQWAVEQAREWGTELTPVVVSAMTGRVPAAFAEQAHDLVGAVSAAVRQAGGQSLQVRPHFLEGAAAPSLLSFVQPEDLLVTGSRGHGGVASLILGGTSTQLAELARCPVVVVREGQVRREVHQRIAHYQVGA